MEKHAEQEIRTLEFKSVCLTPKHMVWFCSEQHGSEQAISGSFADVASQLHSC